jgi:hypothetical protein
VELQGVAFSWEFIESACEHLKLNVPEDDGELMLGPSIADVMLRECTCVLVVLALLHGNDIRHTRAAYTKRTCGYSVLHSSIV